MPFRTWKRRLTDIRIRVGFVLIAAALGFLLVQMYAEAIDQVSSTTVESRSYTSQSLNHQSLKLGNTGRSVRLLQNKLHRLGYLKVGEYKSSTFDEPTDFAVRQFQTDEGITVDGVVGPTTALLIDRVRDGYGKITRSGYEQEVSYTDTSIEPSVEAPTGREDTAILARPQGIPPADIRRIVDRGQLIVSVLSRDNPPFFMANEAGELDGADVRIAREIAENLGVKLELRRTATTFNQVVDDVYMHRADLAVSKISRTLKRAKRTSFSTPYINLRQGLLVNRLQLAQQSNGASMTATIRNLKGKIGVIDGSSYSGFAKQKFPAATIVTYATWPEVIQAVTDGEILAAYRDELEVKKVVLSKPNAALNFQTISLTDTQDAIAVVAAWDSSHLLAFVNQYLETMNVNYTTDSLLAEYSDYFQPESKT